MTTLFISSGDAFIGLEEFDTLFNQIRLQTEIFMTVETWHCSYFTHVLTSLASKLQTFKV